MDSNAPTMADIAYARAQDNKQLLVDLLKKIDALEARVVELEKYSHVPFDFTHLIEQLNRHETRLAALETLDA